MDNSLKEDFVFILEKQSTNLEKSRNSNDSEDYFLTGIAAVFGEENNNNRIYQEDEYLPHLEYLKEKIQQKRLLGELDHPEKFDVSLKNISHVVEDLTYDKEGRVLKIKVKLLDTPAGQIAKKLVDAGIPISISSRAAGKVGDNKRVQIQKIFTYDLVADPGFKNAQLERVYESLNHPEFTSYKDHLAGSNITERLVCLNESLDIKKESGISIYKVDSSDATEFKKLMNTEKNNPGKMDENKKEFVTVDELNKYSIILKNEIDGIKSTLSSLKESQSPIKESESTSDLEKRVDKLEKYSNYLAENLDDSIKYGEYLAENLDGSISYSKYLAENLDKSISYNKYLAENLDKSISYAEYVAENVDRNISKTNSLTEDFNNSISYMEYVAENLDNSILYSEYLAEGLDKGLQYTEYIAEKLDQGLQYTEYVAENLNKNIGYSEYIAENLNKGLEFTDYLNEKLDKSISYSEYIAENVNREYEGSSKINEGNSPINEASFAAEANLNESGYAGDYNGLNEKIDSLIESVNVKKMEESSNRAKIQKAQGVLNESVNNESQQDSGKTGYVFIDNMPEEYKPVWENLSESHKHSIMAQAALRRLETPYQIKNFWATRNLGDSLVGLQKLNENQNSEDLNKEANQSEKYSKNYMDRIGKALEKRFGR